MFGKLAQDLISKLVCPLEKRLDVHQALAHDFFKENEESEDTLDENFSSERHVSILYNNILDINT